MNLAILNTVLIVVLKASPSRRPVPAQPARWKVVLWCAGLVLSAPAIRAAGELISSLTQHGH